jgi:hypothetical protein
MGSSSSSSSAWIRLFKGPFWLQDFLQKLFKIKPNEPFKTVLSIFYMDVPGLVYLWVCSSVVIQEFFFVPFFLNVEAILFDNL